MSPTTLSDVPGLHPRSAVTAAQREEMFTLLTRHFEGVTRRQFERDLEEKNWVIEIRQDARLVGFSTLLIITSQVDSQPITAICSGDTIVAPEARHSPTLARVWIAAVNRLRANFPLQPCYWLLLTSGFRTYRFLPVFWREFFPRCDAVTPPNMSRLLQHLANEYYGSMFNSATGIVRFAQPQRLRDPLADVSETRAIDPHVAFFFQRNPGHVHGDELVCITEISERNLTAAGRRMIAAPLR